MKRFVKFTEATKLLNISPAKLAKWQDAGLIQPTIQDGYVLYALDVLEDLAKISPRTSADYARLQFPESEFLNTTKSALFLGLSKKAFYDLTKSTPIEAFKGAKETFYRKSDINPLRDKIKAVGRPYSSGRLLGDIDISNREIVKSEYHSIWELGAILGCAQPQLKEILKDQGVSVYYHRRILYVAKNEIDRRVLALLV